MHGRPSLPGASLGNSETARLIGRLGEARRELRPKLSSDRWKPAGIVAESYLIDGCIELDEFAFERISLGLVHRGNAELDIEGGLLRKSLGRGGIFCLPPATPITIKLSQADLTVVYLLPDLIPGLATETITSRSLMPQFDPDDVQIIYLLSLVREELQNRLSESGRFLEILGLGLCQHLFRRYSTKLAGYSPYRGGLTPRQLRRAQEKLMAAWEHVPLATLAADAGLSQSHFCRAFKQSTGLSPQQWMRAKRLQCAREMIADRHRSLTSIAGELGYASLSHFSAAFKQAIGISPNRYRRNLLT